MNCPAHNNINGWRKVFITGQAKFNPDSAIKLDMPATNNFTTADIPFSISYMMTV